MRKNILSISLLTGIFLFFFLILNSSFQNELSPWYYQWIIANIQAQQLPAATFFTGSPFLWIALCLIGIFLYLIISGSRSIRIIWILYLCVFASFALIPSLRYRDIGRSYIMTQSGYAMEQTYEGFIPTPTPIALGETVYIRNYLLDHQDIRSDRMYTPILCTEDSRCFIPLTESAYPDLSPLGDVRRPWFRFIP